MVRDNQPFEHVTKTLKLCTKKSGLSKWVVQKLDELVNCSFFNLPTSYQVINFTTPETAPLEALFVENSHLEDTATETVPVALSSDCIRLLSVF